MKASMIALLIGLSLLFCACSTNQQSRAIEYKSPCSCYEFEVITKKG